MSTHEEEVQALDDARRFLLDLGSGAFPATPVSMLRTRARDVMRHYPLGSAYYWHTRPPFVRIVDPDDVPRDVTTIVHRRPREDFARAYWGSIFEFRPTRDSWIDLDGLRLDWDDVTENNPAWGWLP